MKQAFEEFIFCVTVVPLVIVGGLTLIIYVAIHSDSEAYHE